MQILSKLNDNLASQIFCLFHLQHIPDSEQSRDIESVESAIGLSRIGSMHVKRLVMLT